MTQDDSIAKLFEDLADTPGLTDAEKLAGEVLVLEEENEKLKTDLDAANNCLDMLFMKRDEQLEEQKARIAELEEEVKNLRTLKKTPTSKQSGKLGFKI